jgi:hypothetical protein
MLFHDPPPPQVQDGTLPAAAEQHTDSPHFQETAAGAASAETDPLDFQNMTKTQCLIAGGSSLKIDFQVFQEHIWQETHP